MKNDNALFPFSEKSYLDCVKQTFFGIILILLGRKGAQADHQF